MFGFKPKSEDNTKALPIDGGGRSPVFGLAQGRSRGFSPADDLALQVPQAMPPEGGGKIKGPGTGTSDSIPDQMPAGTFIMPADSTKLLGVDALKRLANIPMVPGEFTPEQAHAAGVAFLTSLRDATHVPVATPDMDSDMDAEGSMDVDVADDGSTRNFANGGAVHDRPVLGGYRRSELPTANEIESAVGAKEQAEQQKLAQLQSVQPKDPFGWQAQGKKADIKATQQSLANLKSARAVGYKQLAFGPGTANLSGDSQGNAGAFALAGALQAANGMKAMGRPGDAGTIGPTTGRQQLNSDGTIQGANGHMARGFANGGMVGRDGKRALSANGRDLPGGVRRIGLDRLPDGGQQQGNALDARKPQRLYGGGQVIDPYNIYPYGHPDAGRGIYGGLGTGKNDNKAEAKFTSADNDKLVGQSIKDSWSKGNYGEAVGKTVAGTVGMFTNPLIAGASSGAGAAMDGASAAWGGAKGFGRGLFGGSDVPPKPEKQNADNVPAKQDAPKTDKATPPKADKQPDNGQKKQPPKEMIGGDRTGMTNAEVAQANPDGVVTMKRQPNGVMEFSGNNIKGPVSYADADGNAIAGAGIRGKGFGRVDVAPAGANVVMGPNGSYAYSNNAPAPSRGQQQTGLGFSGAQGRADTASWMQPGMTAEQSLQYNQEVANAQRINAQQRALNPPKPEGTIKMGLMERTPDQQLHDAQVQASSIHAPTAALGKSELARLSAERAALLSRSPTDFDRQKYADSLSRQQQQDAWVMGKNERTYQDSAPERQTKALQAQQAVRTAQLYEAYQNATDPKQQAAIAERLRVLTGKDKPEAWKAIALSGGKDEFGNAQPGGALIINPTTGEHRYVGGGQQGAQPQGVARRPANKAEFDALPKGAKFIDPNGQVRIK